MVKILCLVLLAEAITAVGQVLFKKSTNTLEVHNLKDVNAHFRFLHDILAQPSIWLGFGFMTLGLIVWLVALAQGNLSIVYSIGSLQYVIILFSAHIFLGEKIDKMKFAGTFLIVLGIVLITMS